MACSKTYILPELPSDDGIKGFFQVIINTHAYVHIRTYVYVKCHGCICELLTIMYTVHAYTQYVYRCRPVDRDFNWRALCTKLWTFHLSTGNFLVKKWTFYIRSKLVAFLSRIVNMFCQSVPFSSKIMNLIGKYRVI